MIENQISVLWSIMALYSYNDKELEEFLDKEGARRIFKKMFTMKVISSKLKRKDKQKIILFRISSKLYKKILNIHLKRKR